MNIKIEQFLDECVCEVLYYGFNKDVMVEGVILGLEEEVDYILFVNLFYINDIDVKLVGYDVEKVKVLLDKVGWKFFKGKMVCEKDGKLFEIELMYDLVEFI